MRQSSPSFSYLSSLPSKPLAGAALLIGLALAGCGGDDKTPPEKLTLEVAQRNAQRDVVTGVQTRTFVRTNGWADTNAANLYKVQYGYEMALTDDLPQVALALAKAYETELRGERKEDGGFVAAFTAWGSQWELAIETAQWTAQQDNFAARRDKFLAACVPCVQYWNDTSGKDADVKLRRNVYLRAWSHLEGMGFKDTHKKGDGVGWNITPAFMKTENGWMEAK